MNVSPDRVAAWTRARFGLAPEAHVHVAEGPCTLAGGPLRETVVAFWDAGAQHRFKVFKPLADMNEDDVPAGWLKGSLAVPEGSGECC